MQFYHFFGNFHEMLPPIPKKINKESIISAFWNENVISILLVIFSFCIYLASMCRSVGFTDSGELTAVILTLGIAHPTGYPLFTILGRCWAMIPCPLEETLRMNLFAAFLTAAAVGLFFKTTLVLYRSVAVFHHKKQKETNERRFILASVIAGLVLGFSTTFWSQSTVIEVYALHLVLILFTIEMFVAALEEELTEQDCISRKLILFSFILGLSFSNHMTTILLAPGFLWLYFRLFGFGKGAFVRILRIAPFFLLGLSTYLYLPIRSANRPIFDWGHPATFERFFWHISGKQFRVWMFSSWNVVQKQFAYYIDNFTTEFHSVVIICVIIGLLVLFKRSRRLFIFSILLFCTTIAYAVNYDIFDIDSYFLLSYIVIGWITAFGIDVILHWGENQRPWMRRILVTVICALPVVQLLFHFDGVDESKNSLPQKFVVQAFSNFEKNAVVLATQWDYFISPSLYYQFIRNERRDMTIIDKSLLQNRSWYFLQCDQNAPWLMGRIRSSTNQFLAELDKFEHEMPFDVHYIQSRWQGLLTQIVEESLPEHPVYIDARIDQEFPPQYQCTPAGLFLRLAKNEDTMYYRTAMAPFPAYKKARPAEKDLENYYISMLFRDADWLMRHGKAEEAKTVVNEILRIEPGNLSAGWLLKCIR